MAGKLSFSIAINLLTENFKKGTNTVKNSLRSIQAQILTFAAALGFAGVSITNLISEIIRVSRETSKAITALKNVSGTTAQFADNLRFTTSLAKKYGAYVNDITANFAKFTAAAGIAGMAMEDQRKLFESLSRASAGFGLSADETNGMFLAVTQMMGKGKIQAEELRGQLGERLPIAMQAMAKAAGTTVAGLDEIMKKGKLLSAEVLPKFAEALNEMLPNVDTDNIETSLNRLKNAFQEFIQNTGVQDAYKKLIDSITELVQKATKNIQALIGQLVAVLIGVSLGRFFKWVVTQLVISQRAAMVAASKTAKLAGKTFDEAAWKAQSGAEVIRTAFTRSLTAIRTAFMSMLPTAVFTGIAMLVAKIVEAQKEAKRINAIFTDYKKNSLSIPGIAESENLKQLYRLASNVNEAYNVRKNALDQINDKLGTSFSIDQKNLTLQGDINKVIAQRIKLLEAQAAADYFTPQKIQAQDKIDNIYAQHGGQKQLEGLAKFYLKNYSPGWKVYGEPQALKDYRTVLQNQKIVNDADSKIQNYTRESLSSPLSVTPVEAEKSKKKTNLQKAEETYTESIKELKNKLDNRAITETEYDRELKKLNKATYDTLSGLLTPEQATDNKTFQAAKAGAPNSKTYEAETTYWDEMNRLAGQYAENYLTEKGYAKAKLELTEKTLKEISGMADIGESGQSFVEALRASSDILRKEILKVPEYKERDKTFDYKKTDLEKLQADRDSRQNYADLLKSKLGGDADDIQEKLKAAGVDLENIKKEYNTLAPELIEELNNALGKVTTLDEALKIAEVKKDINDLTKQLNEGLYSGVKDIASNADRLVSAFANLGDVMNNEDATAWERIMAVWNAMINTVDAFMSVIKIIENVTEVIKKLSDAQDSKKKLLGEGVDVAGAAAGLAAREAIATKEIATSKTVTATYSAEMAAKTAAAYAAIPFAGAVLATAQIAAMKSLIAASAVPGFTQGGIIDYGSSTGDKTLARVNRGEMILNGQQQATLFQIANGKGIRTTSGNGKVEFEIKYDRLVGILKNGDQKQRRGR